MDCGTYIKGILRWWYVVVRSSTNGGNATIAVYCGGICNRKSIRCSGKSVMGYIVVGSGECCSG